MIGSIFDHLRRPHDTAPCVVTTKDGHDHPVISADVFKAPEYAGWDVEDVALFQHHLACIAPATPEKAPAAGKNKERLCGVVVVQGIAAVGRLASRADVETMRDRDMHMLVGGFRNPAADDSEVFFLIAARCVGVDKGGLAGVQVAIANDAGFHVLWCHLIGS